MNPLKSLLLLCATLTISSGEPAPELRHAISLFDGQTMKGWEGSSKIWRVQGGCLTGGSLAEAVKENEFLATTRDFTNFVIRLKIKLTGTEGFINSGFQIRSQRVPNSSEMSGYQCDFGDPNWWGAIYDESRRDKVLSPSDMKSIGPAIKRQEWNEYVIRAFGPRITTWINGVEGTDYTESDPKIPGWGKLGIQVHGGGKALVQVKEIEIEVFPAIAPEKEFRGAPEPKKSAAASPLSPSEEQATFSLPDGFEMELVANESEGIGKFVTVDWDQQGRMWSMTALEYPVDANENPETAKALYASIARDKVVVWDHPFGPGPHTPRVFAEGLAIPLGMLPYKNGVYVQHGPKIEFLSDTDGDGKADKIETVLSGFGVQDSHLFPHQFTRAPGNWIWMAQGAFNYGKVRTSKGAEQQFDQTRMAKFRYDGSDFEITSQGPCNIWGLVLNGQGEAFIQEANDYGYPMMQFHEFANYPGCSDAQFKTYAPEFPGTAPNFQMGGTGLSGLALSDAHNAWPEAYANVFYIANPITRMVQAIRIHPDGPRYTLEKLPDFIKSSDEMFRPVSVHFGPDGCLYVVDWYNKIISHNEVPRNHPDRDKKRGRIWRVKHKSQKRFEVPDFTRLPAGQIVEKLGGDSLAQSHLAWQAITDRRLTSLTPELEKIVGDPSARAEKRIASLWAIEGLRQISMELLKPLLSDSNRNIRREAIRAMGEANFDSAEIVSALAPLVNDHDPEVRAQVIRTTGPLVAKNPDALALCVAFADPALSEPTARSTQNGRMIKVREAYEREFQRYLVRFFLEQHPAEVASFLESDAAKHLPSENQLLASLALEPKTSAGMTAALLEKLNRPPSEEELLRLAQFPGEGSAGEVLKQALLGTSSEAVLESLLKIRNRFDPDSLRPLLSSVAASLWTKKSEPAGSSRGLAIRLASAFKLGALQPELRAVLDSSDAAIAEQVNALRGLRETGFNDVGYLSGIFERKTDRTLRNEALGALASIGKEDSAKAVLKLWPEMNYLQRRTALDQLSGGKSGAHVILAGFDSGVLNEGDFSPQLLDKLNTVMAGDAELQKLSTRLDAFSKPQLRLNGKDDAWLDTDITLDGPFTVETWVKLDPGIDNNDGILGAPGVLDMNFFDSHLRVWVGGMNDVIVAKKPMTADSWTHVAVSRNAEGKFRIYLNGELDNADGKPVPQKFEHLRVGWSGPGQGTKGWFSEYRVWKKERSAEEIRASFDRTFEGETQPSELAYYYSGTNWPKQAGSAKAVKTQNFPTLLTSAQASAQEEKFSKFRALAGQSGDATHGQALFSTICMTCHSVQGQGAHIGPVLNGAGAMGTEALLRAILTPNAAMEAGYRTFRVELKDGDLVDGLFVSQDNDAILLRRPNSEDLRVAQDQVRRADFLRVSIMPEGLLDSLSPTDTADLFTYLKSLK